MPDPISAVAGGSIVGGLGSAVIGASATNSAANAQTRAARNEVELQQQLYDDQSQRFAPYEQIGRNALQAYNYELGLGDAPQGYQGISMSPASQFALQQGRDVIEAGAAARGNLFSGATGKALEGYRSNIAMADRDNQLNRLGMLGSTGQAAAGLIGNAAQNQAIGTGNALAAAANANSARAINMGNLFSNALGTGIEGATTGYLMSRSPWFRSGNALAASPSGGWY